MSIVMFVASYKSILCVFKERILCFGLFFFHRSAGLVIILPSMKTLLTITQKEPWTHLTLAAVWPPSLSFQPPDRRFCRTEELLPQSLPSPIAVGLFSDPPLTNSTRSLPLQLRGPCWSSLMAGLLGATSMSCCTSAAWSQVSISTAQPSAAQRATCSCHLAVFPCLQLIFFLSLCCQREGAGTVLTGTGWPWCNFHCWLLELILT